MIFMGKSERFPVKIFPQVNPLRFSMGNDLTNQRFPEEKDPMMPRRLSGWRRLKAGSMMDLIGCLGRTDGEMGRKMYFFVLHPTSSCGVSMRFEFQIGDSY